MLLNTGEARSQNDATCIEQLIRRSQQLTLTVTLDSLGRRSQQPTLTLTLDPVVRRSQQPTLTSTLDPLVRRSQLPTLTLTLIPEVSSSLMSSMFSFSIAAMSADRFRGSTQLMSRVSGVVEYFSMSLEQKFNVMRMCSLGSLWGKMRSAGNTLWSDGHSLSWGVSVWMYGWFILFHIIGIFK